MPRFEPALAELDRVDRVHVEGAEIPEQVVHVVDPEPVVLDAVLVRRAAADVEARGCLVAAGDAGQELKRAKQIALAQARQHRDLFGGELDAADVVGGVEHRHLRDDRHVGCERRRQNEVDAGAERSRDLNRGIGAGEVGQFGEQDEPARQARGLEHVRPVAVRDGDQLRTEDPDAGAGEAGPAGCLHGAGDPYARGGSARSVLRESVGCGRRAQREHEEIAYGSGHGPFLRGEADHSGSSCTERGSRQAAGAGTQPPLTVPK